MIVDDEENEWVEYLLRKQQEEAEYERYLVENGYYDNCPQELKPTCLLGSRTLSSTVDDIKNIQKQ